ncbi:6-O-methylguanine DNA methyltransferase [Streptomyces ipomoeae]|uniref:6-O-methylguanine DNA methyltransferase n=2 Tax=Streptomyces ipomoeae TaxID=103232 RepID=A0AAE9AVR4_9ACTN|nr:MGMT family protein [Streptomyces ipomoeae]MDX2828109.1 MGMT family protein [Streptomyces ipomoeae]MDX2839157.1 MGMT family protein [Streptomyces ipomoeae]MDX2880611.1 MGMT family protein [Streptomyces ipomoeae]TQE14860.1 6-O-methylguanine DNA methyltransferase [Streptomyces ipomoeae]
MVACPVGTQGHQGAMRGRTVCPKTAAGARDARVGHHVPLSVGWGRMGRMSEESLPVDALPEYAERVLEVAELIPPGRVMTYGDVAEWLEEGGPRQVGRVMALYGGAVPWWRVVRADGTLLPGHELRALDHYRAEGTPLRAASRAAEGHVPRIDMKRARWDGDARVEGHT